MPGCHDEAQPSDQSGVLDPPLPERFKGCVRVRSQSRTCAGEPGAPSIEGVASQVLDGDVLRYPTNGIGERIIENVVFVLTSVRGSLSAIQTRDDQVVWVYVRSANSSEGPRCRVARGPDARRERPAGGLSDRSRRVSAVTYLVGSMVVGLLLVWIGFRVGDRVALKDRPKGALTRPERRNAAVRTGVPL